MDEVGCFDVGTIRMGFHPSADRRVVIDAMGVAAGSDVDEPGKLCFDRPSLQLKLFKRVGESSVVVVVEFFEKLCEHTIDSTLTYI